MNKLKLLCGEDYILSNNIKIKHPKISDLKNMGDRDYFSFVYLFCTQTHEMMVQLHDAGIDYEEISDYDLFFLMYQSNKKKYDEMFYYFMNLIKVDIGIKASNNERVLYGYIENKPNKENEKNIIISDFIIDKKIFEEISLFFKTIHLYKNKEKPKFANKGVKELYIELEREEMEDSQKGNSNGFQTLISSLIWGSSNGTNYNNVWNLYMYQFQDGISRLNKIREYENVMNGIYNGTIEQKKINLEKINWLSDITN